MKRYLLYSFYPALGTPVIAKDFSRRNDMFEYIASLRLCDTPYIAIDTKNDGAILDKEVYDLGGLKMAEMLEKMWREE